MPQLEVTVPPDTAPGSSMRVALPNGGEMDFVVPEGVAPGQAILVEYEDAPKVQAVARATAVPTESTRTVVVMQEGSNGGNAPPGAPRGGHYINVAYFGCLSCVWLMCFPVPIVDCIPCCYPFDTRTIYAAPDGQRYRQTGDVHRPGCCERAR